MKSAPLLVKPVNPFATSASLHSHASTSPSAYGTYRVAPAKAGRVNRDMGTGAILHRAPVTMLPHDTKTHVTEAFEGKKTVIVVTEQEKDKGPRKRRCLAIAPRLQCCIALLKCCFHPVVPKAVKLSVINARSLELAKTLLSTCTTCGCLRFWALTGRRGFLCN